MLSGIPFNFFKLWFSLVNFSFILLPMDFTMKDFSLPENTFHFYNTNLKPLTFVLDWDTKDKFYFILLNRFMGYTIDKPDEHSLVLSNPKGCSYFHRYIPAFDIKYIEDCFELKDYPDPSKYLIQNSCLINYEDDDIFDCWYHKKKSWSEFVSISKEKPGCSNQIETCSSAYKNSLESDSDKDDHYKRNEDVHSTMYSCTTNTSKKRTRLPYTHKEDAKIVEFIVKHKGAFQISGRELWQNMEQANVCSVRSWQSMKERYIKHIKWDLRTGSYKFPFLSKSDLIELRQGLKIDVISGHQKEKLKSKFQEMMRDDLSSD